MVTILDKRPRHPEKAHKPDTPVLRKPDWIRVKVPASSPQFAETRAILREHGLVTVCEEAGCPNIAECWAGRHATMMIMGDTCTRACAFCNVKTGLPGALDAGEPENVAQAVAKLGLDHIVITSVDRDDLDDGGAAHFAATIRAIRALTPNTTIEVLTPDFLRKDGALETVVAAAPDVYNHNLETVPALYLKIRPGARYFHSLRLLQRVKELSPAMFTKSGHHGGPRRDARRGAAGHGRPAVGGRGFPDHRPVSAADAQACRGEKLRDAGRVQGLRAHRAVEGLPDGVGEPADALVLSCRRRLRAAARGATGEIAAPKPSRPRAR